MRCHFVFSFLAVALLSFLAMGCGESGRESLEKSSIDATGKTAIHRELPKNEGADEPSIQKFAEENAVADRASSDDLPADLSKTESRSAESSVSFRAEKESADGVPAAKRTPKPKSNSAPVATTPHEESVKRNDDASPETSRETKSLTKTIPAEKKNRYGNRQAGILTAGSIDDNEKFSDYRNFLSTTLQSYRSSSIPSFEIGQRVIIQVVDAEGNGIGDATVTVSNVDQQVDSPADSSENFSIRTGSDGRTLFLSGIDNKSASNEFMISVQHPDSQQGISKRVSLNQIPWQITLPNVEARTPQKLDLALVIDTTGSMGDELEYLKVEIDSIAAAIKKRFPNVDQRYALILYRDSGDEYVTRTFDFTSSLESFRDHLANQSAAGGGDTPEAMHIALEQAENLSWRSQETARVIFLVGDAPPHNNFASRALSSMKKLRLDDITIFPVAASGVEKRAEFLMRSAAFLTLGQYLFLTDHSGVGNAHAKPQTPSFSVEKLNQLMIRMIATEIAGEPFLPRDIIAIEEGEENTESTPIESGQNQTSASPPSKPFASSCIMPAVYPSKIERFLSWCESNGGLSLLILAFTFVGAFFFESRERKPY